jgi:hypothetical protein
MAPSKARSLTNSVKSKLTRGLWHTPCGCYQRTTRRRWYLMKIQDKERDPRAIATEEKPKEKQPSKQKDPVDKASDESFPASDPPGSY